MAVGTGDNTWNITKGCIKSPERVSGEAKTLNKLRKGKSLKSLKTAFCIPKNLPSPRRRKGKNYMFLGEEAV
eukprot:2376678-Ditylum_brightwellii.AAC.1